MQREAESGPEPPYLQQKAPPFWLFATSSVAGLLLSSNFASPHPCAKKEKKNCFSEPHNCTVAIIFHSNNQATTPHFRLPSTPDYYLVAILLTTCVSNSRINTDEQETHHPHLTNSLSIAHNNISSSSSLQEKGYPFFSPLGRRKRAFFFPSFVPF